MQSSRVGDCDACAWSQTADVDFAREVVSTSAIRNVGYVAGLVCALVVGRDIARLRVAGGV